MIAIAMLLPMSAFAYSLKINEIDPADCGPFQVGVSGTADYGQDQHDTLQVSQNGQIIYSTAREPEDWNTSQTVNVGDNTFDAQILDASSTILAEDSLSLTESVCQAATALVPTQTEIAPTAPAPSTIQLTAQVSTSSTSTDETLTLSFDQIIQIIRILIQYGIIKIQ